MAAGNLDFAPENLPDIYGNRVFRVENGKVSRFIRYDADIHQTVVIADFGGQSLILGPEIYSGKRRIYVGQEYDAEMIYGLRRADVDSGKNAFRGGEKLADGTYTSRSTVVSGSTTARRKSPSAPSMARSARLSGLSSEIISTARSRAGTTRTATASSIVRTCISRTTPAASCCACCRMKSPRSVRGSPSRRLRTTICTFSESNKKASAGKVRFACGSLSLFSQRLSSQRASEYRRRPDF